MPHSLDQLMNLPNEALAEAAKTLSSEDIAALVTLLATKEDDVRYQAFLLLKNARALKPMCSPPGKRFGKAPKR